jgi:iron complex outermembrane receptor protein
LFFLGQAQSTAAEQMDTSQLTYNIEAQNLKSALEIYQKTSGLNLAYSDDLVQDKMTDGVYGKNTTAHALKKILKGTGLTYTVTSPQKDSKRHRPDLHGYQSGYGSFEGK